MKGLRKKVPTADPFLCRIEMFNFLQTYRGRNPAEADECSNFPLPHRRDWKEGNLKTGQRSLQGLGAIPFIAMRDASYRIRDVTLVFLFHGGGIFFLAFALCAVCA